jgi:hypothetical protein
MTKAMIPCYEGQGAERNSKQQPRFSQGRSMWYIVGVLGLLCVYAAICIGQAHRRMWREERRRNAIMAYRCAQRDRASSPSSKPEGIIKTGNTLEHIDTNRPFDVAGSPELPTNERF